MATEEGLREELDCRLLYQAIGNRAYIGGATLDDFRKTSTTTIKIIMSEMMAGRTYLRPTIEEAQLSTKEGVEFELLRMSPVTKVPPIDFSFHGVRKRTSAGKIPTSFSRQPSIDDLELGYSYSTCGKKKNRGRKSGSWSAAASSNRSQGSSVHPPYWAKVTADEARELLKCCCDLWSEENVQSRELFNKLKRAAETSPRGGAIPKSLKAPSVTNSNLMSTCQEIPDHSMM